MTLNPRIWIPAAWLLSLGNVIAVWFAARPAEPWHATGHAVFAVLCAIWAVRMEEPDTTPPR